MPWEWIYLYSQLHSQYFSPIMRSSNDRLWWVYTMSVCVGVWVCEPSSPTRGLSCYISHFNVNKHISWNTMHWPHPHPFSLEMTTFEYIWNCHLNTQKANKICTLGRIIESFTCFPWKMMVLGKHNVCLDWEEKEGQKEKEDVVVPSVPCPGNDPKVIF